MSHDGVGVDMDLWRILHMNSYLLGDRLVSITSTADVAACMISVGAGEFENCSVICHGDVISQVLISMGSLFDPCQRW